MTIKNADMPVVPLATNYMTKRELIAMHMMSGLLSDPGHSFSEHDVARDAVRAAEALLAALEHTK